MKTCKMTMALVLMSAMTACDYAQKRDFRHERKDARYQNAMNDYRAGRLDRAMDEFSRLVKDNPVNASARFQFACLLQDSKRDFLAAYCQYREYLLQHPESERAKLARDRMADCEREMAKELAEKHGIASGKAFAEEIEKLRSAVKESERKYARIGDELAEAKSKIASLEDDRRRLVKNLRSDTDKEESLSAPSLKDAKALLDDDDEDTDRVKLSQDVKALKTEGADELKAAEKSIAVLPVEPQQAAKAKQEAKKKALDAKNAKPQRPEHYIVEEGDTLYGIAERFYGRKSAWVEIRNANKTVISLDGRIKAGDRIKLP